MQNVNKKAALTDLMRIPGVGRTTAQDLWDLGFDSVESLRNQSPEDLYAQECTRAGRMVDRCVLYVYRCAVYFASNDQHDPELLKWWKWKEAVTS